MRRYLLVPSVIFTLGLLLLGSSIFLFLYPEKSQGADELVSPVVVEPEKEIIYTSSIYERIKNEKTTDNYPPSEYFPTSLTPKFSVDLDLSAKAYAVMDRDTKELLLGKNINEEKQIASLTKVMTALVALEKEKPERELVVPAFASEVGEATMGLSRGERYTLEELLYGLLMISGNDAAETIANNLGRGRYWFIDEMNKKAYGLGLRDTYFVNPTGLDEATPQESTFSTALDLLGLTNLALNNKTLAKIVSTQYHTIDYKQDIHKAIYLESILSFDRTYPGIAGVKTGNTDFARQTLISYAENKGKKILVVLLDSEATRDDAIKIYRYIFENTIE